jgi:hypothetical protein
LHCAKTLFEIESEEMCLKLSTIPGQANCMTVLTGHLFIATTFPATGSHGEPIIPILIALVSMSITGRNGLH